MSATSRAPHKRIRSGLALSLAAIATAAICTPTLTPTPPAPRYRVVLVDGSEYVAREPYQTKGRLALFTLLSGQLVSIPLDTVNEQATRAANFKTPVPPTPPLTATALSPTPRWSKANAPRINMSGTPQRYEPGPPVTPLPMPVYMVFRGQGHEVTKLFQLEPGLYVFHAIHTGERNFIVYLRDAVGRSTLVANEIGPCDGTRSARVERRSDYLLDVGADGGWMVTIETPH